MGVINNDRIFDDKDDPGVGIFADDPVVKDVKEAVRRREEDAAKQEQAKYDAEVVDIFRAALLEEYDVELLEITEKSISKETEAAYAGDINRFRKWCAKIGISDMPC